MKIVKTENEIAENIMQKDAFLLEKLKDEPILHLYEWKGDSLTYGYFINIEKHIDLATARKRGLSLARRPTGGGIVFHLWDLAFSFLMPSSNKNFFNNPLDNYKFVNSIVLDAVKKYLDSSLSFYEEEIKDAGEKVKEDFFKTDQKNNNFNHSPNFCMAKPSKYDLIYNNKKIAGAAQRKKLNGYLHQGSISLIMPDVSYMQEVLINKEVVLDIFYNSHPIFKSDLKEKKEVIKKNLITSFSDKIF
ncbi:MAG: hypothetical protein WCT85_01390 [Parachlamydiales bacterium]|jgi:lipoate-protein ligase A